MQHFPKIFLSLNGIIYSVLALLFVIAPLEWFARLGIELQDALGYTELKTMYIGLMGSLGIYSLLAVFKTHLQYGALLLFLLSYGALATVRSWGILIEGVYDDFTVQLLVAEIISAGAAACGLVISAKQRSA